MQDDRFILYIFTKYIKITAFQTSPVEKERNKPPNFTFYNSFEAFVEFQFITNVWMQLFFAV